jgi:hypothetical protein|tara:strand:+ start:753 stop:974 length:222 start_codon:yes stop_codon:yes gene_type:complete
MSYRGGKLTIEITPIELEVLTTALFNPQVAEFLDENDEDKMLNALHALEPKLLEISQMVNDAGFGYDDNWGEN